MNGVAYLKSEAVQFDNHLYQGPSDNGLASYNHNCASKVSVVLAVNGNIIRVGAPCCETNDF